MLLQIRDFIRHQGVVSTQQLAREFCLDLAALKPMLQLWVNKGVIQKCQEKNGCKSACFKCQAPPEYYQYSTQ